MINKELSLRVLSIDPGFNNLGVAFSTLNYHSNLQVVNNVTTFNIPRLIRLDDDPLTDHVSHYLVNSKKVYDIIRYNLESCLPDVIICEAAYLGSFANAFVSLSLCIQAVERAVYDYDFDVGFYTIDPSSVKKANGVKGNSKDKEEMRTAIIANPNIVSVVDFTKIDEHSVDAIAIGQCYFTRTRV